MTSPRIPLRPLGATGLVVGRIGLGLAALGRPAYINLGRPDDYAGARTTEVMEMRCHQMLDAAHQAGVRYVDAARSYGLSEEFLARWLTNRGQSVADMTVGSKWGYTYVGEWQVQADVHEVKDLSAPHLREQYAESRVLLGDRLNLYQIHSATLESGVLDDRAVISELQAIRAAGVIVGLTVTGPAQADTIRRAMDVEVDGAPLFQVVQATWNLLEPSAGPALAEASASGRGVIIKEGVANGRLTSRNDDDGLATLRDYASSLGTTVDVVALGAALAQPWVDVVLSGAVTIEQLASNLLAVELSQRMSGWPDVAERAHDYWAHRSGMAWI